MAPANRSRSQERCLDTYRDMATGSGLDVHMLAFLDCNVGGLGVDLRSFVGWIWVDSDGFGWIL